MNGKDDPPDENYSGLESEFDDDFDDAPSFEAEVWAEAEVEASFHNEYEAGPGEDVEAGAESLENAEPHSGTESDLNDEVGTEGDIASVLSSEDEQAPCNNSIFTSEWGMVLFDEAHNARNLESRRSQLARRFSECADLVVAVTATPVFNSPLDFLHIRHAAGLDVATCPGLHPPLPRQRGKDLPPRKQEKLEKLYSDWHPDWFPLIIACHLVEQDFSKLTRRLSKPCGEVDPFALQAILKSNGTSPTPFSGKVPDWAGDWKTILNTTQTLMDVALDMAGPHFMRRKADTIILGQSLFPTLDCKTTPIFVELDRSHRIAYDEAWNKESDLSNPKQASDIMTRLAKARRGLISSKVLGDDLLPSKKLRAVLDRLIPMIEGDAKLPISQRRKFVIYMHWATSFMVDDVLECFDENGVPCAALNGNSRPAKRQALLEQFQKDGDHPSDYGPSRVLIISDAISSSINLHRANVLFLLDRTWTSAKEDQIIGRLTRLGQTRTVEVMPVLVMASIDIHMLFFVLRKRRMTDRLDACSTGLLHTPPPPNRRPHSRRGGAITGNMNPEPSRSGVPLMGVGSDASGNERNNGPNERAEVGGRGTAASRKRRNARSGHPANKTEHSVSMRDSATEDENGTGSGVGLHRIPESTTRKNLSRSGSSTGGNSNRRSGSSPGVDPVENASNNAGSREGAPGRPGIHVLLSKNRKAGKDQTVESSTTGTEISNVSASCSVCYCPPANRKPRKRKGITVRWGTNKGRRPK